MSVKNTLSSLLDNFNEEFKRAAEESRRAQLPNLKPGTPIPGYGKIYGEDNRKVFQEKSTSYYNQAISAIKDAKTTVSKKMAEAPSQDAVNSISMLRTRKHISQDDIDNLLEWYGDNYQAYKAVSSIALENEMTVLKKHPLEEQKESLDMLETSFGSLFNLNSIEKRDSLDGIISFTKWELDNLPDM